MDKVEFLMYVSFIIFAIGFLGVIIRRNVLVLLMCLELMLNAVNLNLVTASSFHQNASGAVLVFLIFIIAASEIALAIPIVLLLFKSKNTLDLKAFSDLKG